MTAVLAPGVTGGVGGTTCAEANEPTEQSAASTVARPTLEVPGRDGLFEFVSGIMFRFGFSIFTILFFLFRTWVF